MKFKQFLIEGIISSPKRVRRPVGNGLNPMPPRELQSIDFPQNQVKAPAPPNYVTRDQNGELITGPHLNPNAPNSPQPPKRVPLTPQQQQQQIATKRRLNQNIASGADAATIPGARPTPQPQPGAFDPIENQILQIAKTALQSNNSQQFDQLVNLVRSTNGISGDNNFGQPYFRTRANNGRQQPINPGLEAQKIAKRLAKADPRVKQELSRILSQGK